MRGGLSSMMIKKFIDRIAENKRDKKDYFFSRKTNEVYTLKNSKEVDVNPMTVVYQYYNIYRKSTYIAWIDDVKPKGIKSQLLLFLGKTNSNKIISGMEQIELLTDEYEKLNFITKLIEKV